MVRWSQSNSEASLGCHVRCGRPSFIFLDLEDTPSILRLVLRFLDAEIFHSLWWNSLAAFRRENPTTVRPQRFTTRPGPFQTATAVRPITGAPRTPSVALTPPSGACRGGRCSSVPEAGSLQPPVRVRVEFPEAWIWTEVQSE